MKQGSTYTYDPYGNTLTGIPDNTAGNSDTAWTGQRPLEHESGVLPLIEMGARPYSSVLGRFLANDPKLGGNANDYNYPNDPINQRDLDGKCPWCSIYTGKLALLVRYLDTLSSSGDWTNDPGTDEQFDRAVAWTVDNYDYYQRQGLIGPAASGDFSLSDLAKAAGTVLQTGGIAAALETDGVSLVLVPVGFTLTAVGIATDSKGCKGRRIAYQGLGTMIAAPVGGEGPVGNAISIAISQMGWWDPNC